MDLDAFRHHGRAILETAKDHLAAAMERAPAEGWTPAEWAAAAGLLLDGAPFPAVFAHHLAPVLVHEGRALLVSDEGVPRYGAAAQRHAEPPTAAAAATAAPQVWSSGRNEQVEVGRASGEGMAPGPFPPGEADEEPRPEGDTGPWIP